MKRPLIISGAILLILFAFAQHSYAQGILKKIKNKAEDKMIDKVFGEDEKTQEQGNNTGVYSNDNTSSGRPANTRGEGLISTPPDVKQNIADASGAFNSKNYGQSRFNTRQAILGVELEIGNNILDGLPESINGLPMVKEEDQVASSGIGFVGLIIQRAYRQGDQQLTITIGNDAAMLSAVNMYLSSGAYGSTDQNYKQVQYKEYRGVLEYDESSGYKLSVPFGQSSILVVEGVNFSNEQEIMDAAGEIDVDKIKNELGEK